MADKFDLILDGIKSTRNDFKSFKDDHKKLHEKLDDTISSAIKEVSKIKTKLLAIACVVLGVIIVLTAQGHIPEGLMKLAKLFY